MPRAGQTRREAMRELRQEDLRERIKSSNLMTDLIGSIDEIRGLDPTAEAHSNSLAGIKAQNEVRIKLLNKVLPDLKALDLSGEIKGRLFAVDLTGVDGGDSLEDEEAEQRDES